ncbi:hypothetical protein CDS [Salmonella enterica subsp. enterica serovar Derby]|nr:hypothetical protein CDS [Salmonella enterica subsp. enterica serovar Derby]
MANITRLIFHRYRQRIVAISPRAAGYKTPLPVSLRQLHLLAVTIAHHLHDDLSHVRINTADNKTRRFNVSLIIVGGAAIICAIQRDGRCRQCGINDKIERFRRRVACNIGCFHCQGIRIFDQICRPYILPNAVRRQRCVNPVDAAIKTQLHRVHVRRYRNMKLWTCFIGQVIPDNTRVIKKLNAINRRLRIDSHRQRRRIICITRLIFYLYRQRIVAIGPGCARRKAPHTAVLNQLYLLVLTIMRHRHHHFGHVGVNITEGKAWHLNVGDVIASGAIIRAVQGNRRF